MSKKSLDPATANIFVGGGKPVQAPSMKKKPVRRFSILLPEKYGKFIEDYQIYLIQNTADPKISQSQVIMDALEALEKNSEVKFIKEE